MTRLVPLGLILVLLSSNAASASEEPAKDTASTSHYVEFPTMTATIVRPDRRRGVLAVDATLDVPDNALRARVASLAPRLRAAYAQTLTVYAASLPPGRPADPDYLGRELQRQTDLAVGKSGAKFLLGSILVN
jgi:flagellar basal body-associated protein FliL